MTRNKHRLLLALYARPQFPNSTHYALLLTPKIFQQHRDKKQLITGFKYHARNILTMINGEPDIPWRKEIVYCHNLDTEPNLLVCGVIAKVKDVTRFEAVLHHTPVYQIDDFDTDMARSFNCASFVKDAFQRLRKESVVTRWADFSKAEEELLAYMREYRERGRWGTATHYDIVPVLDLMTHKELRS